MAILHIVKHPAKVLETTCDPVEEFNEALHLLLEDMFETMYAADGVGLAAPQINIAKQIAVIDISEDGSGKLELVNPVIEKSMGEQTGLEGCLSFPGVYGDVTRAEKIKVKAQNRYGNTFIIEVEGYFARAVQHEIDHLNGVLFTSKVIQFYELEEQEGGDGND